MVDEDEVLIHIDSSEPESDRITKLNEALSPHFNLKQLTIVANDVDPVHIDDRVKRLAAWMIARMVAEHVGEENIRVVFGPLCYNAELTIQMKIPKGGTE
jgi:DNA-binding transcriptional regulator LsrR (DeoR family)